MGRLTIGPLHGLVLNHPLFPVALLAAVWVNTPVSSPSMGLLLTVLIILVLLVIINAGEHNSDDDLL